MFQNFEQDNLIANNSTISPENSFFLFSEKNEIIEEKINWVNTFEIQEYSMGEFSDNIEIYKL